ncbi:MAG: pantoate--beta-alanine ligase [Candidatus Omnitrophica bacterium]|jgi:pantoate--beta-alanine ligase|nr:pantoate--beta-alanine ligase [Candidatus Omnitrophota bacterium]
MVIAKTIKHVRKIIFAAKQKNKTIGFVPTMGALHYGHLSLVRAARKNCDFVVVSIFINPTQFGPKEDFRKYPRQFNQDKRLLEIEKVDLVFYPSAAEMYLKDSSTYIKEVYLSEPLCGSTRPGHFRGVCTVVAKLFNIIEPDIAYFGQKDYQQARVVKRMVRDLNFPVKIKIFPTLRERSGLAMSSRNAYLDQKARGDALVLFESLKLAKKLVKEGERDPKKIINKIRKLIISIKNAKIDYVKIVDVENLRPVDKIKAKVAVVLAVYIGKIRLIDNVLVDANSN